MKNILIVSPHAGIARRVHDLIETQIPDGLIDVEVLVGTRRSSAGGSTGSQAAATDEVSALRSVSNVIHTRLTTIGRDSMVVSVQTLVHRVDVEAPPMGEAQGRRRRPETWVSSIDAAELEEAFVHGAAFELVSVAGVGASGGGSGTAMTSSKARVRIPALGSRGASAVVQDNQGWPLVPLEMMQRVPGIEITGSFGAVFGTPDGFSADINRLAGALLPRPMEPEALGAERPFR